MELNGFVIVLLRLQIREIPIRTFPYVVYYCIVFTGSQWSWVIGFSVVRTTTGP